jgi:hypothetical protein
MTFHWRTTERLRAHYLAQRPRGLRRAAGRLIGCGMSAFWLLWGMAAVASCTSYAMALRAQSQQKKAKLQGIGGALATLAGAALLVAVLGARARAS